MKMKKICCILFLFIYISGYAQEFVAPLMNNHRINREADLSVPSVGRRDEPIQLPFYDDFHSYDTSIYPIDYWWVDSQAYINNHFVLHSLNKGVATLDVLNEFGFPYPVSATEDVYCDSLTSYFIDLSSYDANDSIYLSFAYLCKGLGFAPKPLDSLLIYFEDELTGWKLVGFLKPDTSSQWKHKLIPVIDGNYYFENFRFRIINKGTIGSSSSHWHLDNIYMDADRNYTDTQIRDMAFTYPPSNMLNDFTSMPFKHFNTDRMSFMASAYQANIYNAQYMGGATSANVSYQARNASSGTVYGSADLDLLFAPLETTSFELPPYSPTSFSPDGDGHLSILQTYHFNPVIGDEIRENDSITHLQEFANYFSYDDGSAEQAYYLNLAPATPGKIALEYATYVPDTLVGIDIQFARQVPGGDDKEFFIQIFKSIELGGSGGELIYEEEGFYPIYPESPRQFHTYALDEIVPLGTGVYYIVIMMPASGISDSLMVALDRNRTGANHRYYNVLDVWESSTLEGALMVRPIMGSERLTSVDQLNEDAHRFTIYPNPAENILNLSAKEDILTDRLTYRIMDLHGRSIIKGSNPNNGIDISSIPSGAYLIQFTYEKGIVEHCKFIKK